MRRSSFPSIAAIVAASATWTPVAAEPELSAIAGERTAFSDAALTGESVDLDAVNSVLRRAGRDAAPHIAPPTRDLANARAARSDVLTGVFLGEGVALATAHAGPFMSAEFRIVRRVARTASRRTLDDVRPCAGARGARFLVETEFDAAAYSRKVEVAKTVRALRRIAAGRIDLTVDDARKMVSAIPAEDPAPPGAREYSGEPLATRKVGTEATRARPDHEAVVDAFDAARRGTRADGSLASSLARHVTN